MNFGIRLWRSMMQAAGFYVLSLLIALILWAAVLIGYDIGAHCHWHWSVGYSICAILVAGYFALVALYYFLLNRP